MIPRLRRTRLVERKIVVCCRCTLHYFLLCDTFLLSVSFEFCCFRWGDGPVFDLFLWAFERDLDSGTTIMSCSVAGRLGV